MTGAMYAAVSGLKTHMSAMNVIGNNISNVNTVGYKSTLYTFNEALYTSVKAGSDGTNQLGGRNPAQIGYGCSIGTIDLDMSTKNYTPTGIALHCMIDGDGFFIVGNNKENSGITKQSQLQGMNLSRLGNLGFDSQGYLVDGNGSLVYGFLRMTSLDEYCEATGKDPSEVTEEELCSPILTPIRYPMCYVGGAEAEDGTQSTQKMKTTIFWPQVAEDGGDQLIRDGLADDEREDDFEVPEGGVLTRLQPNTVSIDSTGCITAMTKDEQLVVVGYIALATVDNPNGVTHVDGRYYKALGGAGNVHLTTIGGRLTHDPRANAADGDTEIDLGSTDLTIESTGDTELVTGGLESSGTDLAQEISNRIMIQRGYQANTRIVTVTDSMLEELVNMKR